MDPCGMTISDLCYGLKSEVDEKHKRCHFYIPSYQRGYRWTKKHVTRLLNDLNEFTKSKSDEFYCLQPVIVKKLKDKETDTELHYEVVDGQQRLSTILVLLKVFKYIDNDLFELYFERDSAKKEREEFLRNIGSSSTADDYNLIDNIFLRDAYETAITWLKNNSSSDIIKNMREKLAYYTKIIWYELGRKSNAYKVFSNVNGGKIKLTNSELVKAMILRNTPDKSYTAARLWDEVERQLHIDGFWAFITQDDAKYQGRYETRMDYVLELLYKTNTGVKGIIKSEDVFEYFENTLEDLEKSKRKEKAETLLTEVRHFFRNFQDWYENVQFYNFVGYLVTQGEKEISDLLCFYKNNGKDEFLDELKSYVIDSLELPGMSSEKEITEYLLGQEDDVTAGLLYGKSSDNNSIIKILLVFNILTCNDMGRKFIFSTKGGWSLEHIRAQKSDDVKKDLRQEFVQGYIDAIPHRIKEGKENKDSRKELGILKKSLEKYIEENEFSDKSKFSSVFDEISAIYEKDSVANTHSISNLALLGRLDNSSLLDSAFSKKREKILDMLANIGKEATHNIPVCTEHIFIKAYSGDVTNFYYWSKSDGKKYIEKIAGRLFSLAPFSSKKTGGSL